MASAVYDNPITMAREAWVDGQLVASISLKLMYIRGFNGFPELPFMLNCGPWEEGKSRGDSEAVPTQLREQHHDQQD